METLLPLWYTDNEQEKWAFHGNLHNSAKTLIYGNMAFSGDAENRCIQEDDNTSKRETPWQGYLGYCLLPTTKGQKMLLLIGKGGEGIFLWMLDGLHRLIRQNYQFIISPHARENVETVRRSSNNVVEFLQSEGYIRFRAGSEVSSREIYEAYKIWCENKVKGVMPEALCAQLMNRIPTS